MICWNGKISYHSKTNFWDYTHIIIRDIHNLLDSSVSHFFLEVPKITRQNLTRKNERWRVKLLKYNHTYVWVYVCTKVEMGSRWLFVLMFIRGEKKGYSNFWYLTLCAPKVFFSVSSIEIWYNVSGYRHIILSRILLFFESKAPNSQRMRML